MRSPTTGFTDNWEPLGVGGLNSGTFQEQGVVLTTELTLQPGDLNLQEDTRRKGNAKSVIKGKI